MSDVGKKTGKSALAMDQAGSRITTAIGIITLEHLLGKGKSGHSWLATCGNGQVVFKRMHHEPCPFYDFGDRNKVEMEVAAYQYLQPFALNLPQLLCACPAEDYLLKSYVEGVVATHAVIDGTLGDDTLSALFQLARRCQDAQINLDWFPDNFVIRAGVLHYIDYEFNQYDRRWSWPQWGIYYWLNGSGMAAFKASGDAAHINAPAASGMPIREPFRQRANALIEKFAH